MSHCTSNGEALVRPLGSQDGSKQGIAKNCLLTNVDVTCSLSSGLSDVFPQEATSSTLIDLTTCRFPSRAGAVAPLS